MLRTARSLPSLRLLYQQEISAVKCQTATTAASSVVSSELFHAPVKSTYSMVSGDLFQPSTPFTTSVRYVHQTTKKETILLDSSSSNKSKYTSMNLVGLKAECRKRNLKVSGRKLDLVQRLINEDQTGNDNSRSFTHMSHDISTTTPGTPNPKFVKLDNQIKKGKIAQLIKTQTELKNKEVKKSINKMKIQKKADNIVEQKAKKNEKLVNEQKNREEIRLHAERIRILKDAEERAEKLKAKKIAEKKALEQKLAQEAQKRTLELNAKKEQEKRALEIKLEEQRKLEEQKIQRLQAAKAQFEQEVKLTQDFTKNTINSITKQKQITNVLLKARDQSKSKVVEEAKLHLQTQARQQQREREQQNSREKVELSSRDVKFLTAVTATTIGWWSLKDTAV